MRMWLVDPQTLCQRHLLGEHVELHMFVGTILKGNSISGYCHSGLCDPSKIITRHEELVAEMLRRGMQHNSPLKEFIVPDILGVVDVANNLLDLAYRCSTCRKRQQEVLNASK